MQLQVLDDCQILLKVNLIKPDHLLSILNQINNNIQFTNNKWKWYKNLDGYLHKLIDSKWYVPFMSNLPRHCLTNIPFSLAGRKNTIVQNENVNEKQFKNWKKNLY